MNGGGVFIEVEGGRRCLTGLKRLNVGVTNIVHYVIVCYVTSPLSWLRLKILGCIYRLPLSSRKAVSMA